MNKKEIAREIYEIRRENLRQLRAAYRGPGSFTEALGYKPDSAYVTQLLGPSPTRNVSELNARRYELRLGLEPRYLDVRHVDAPAEHRSERKRADVALQDVHKLLARLAEGLDIPDEKYRRLARNVYDKARAEGRIDEAYARELVFLAGEERTPNDK